MNIKPLLITLVVVSSLPLAAHAEITEANASGTPSLLENLLWTVLPFLVIGVLFYFFFVRSIKKNAKKSEDYMARQKQHQERVEQLLERIAKALERKDKDGP